MTPLPAATVAAVVKSCRDKSKTCRAIAKSCGVSPASVIRISYAHGISRWRPVAVNKKPKRDRVGYDEVGSVFAWRAASEYFWKKRGMAELARVW